MPLTLIDHLTFLYDSATARSVFPRLIEIMHKYSSRFSAVTPNRTEAVLNEHDVLLITCADQALETGEPPVQALTNLLNAHLAYIISGVHLLPFYPSSSDDGFSVVNYRATDSALGTWNDIARLGQGFDLMFDAVINHVSAQSEWFKRFLQDDPAYRDFFIVVEGTPDLSRVVRPRTLPLLTKFQTPSGEREVWTTFSADQIDLNYRDPDVLLAMLDVLLFYVERGARFIRLDAVAYLWKEIGTPCIHLPQTHAIVQLIRAVLNEVAPWVMLITETNVPHSENIAYFGDGTNEAQLVYNFALPPLVLHTFLTGDATALSRWVQTLTLPSDRVTFFNFLALHDGIGLNPVRGILSDEEINTLVEHTQVHSGLISYKQNADGTRSPHELIINYFDALSNANDLTEPLANQVNRFIASQAIMLSLAGVPGIYFHSLFGSRGDRASAEATAIPRRVNRQKLSRADLERDLANPESLRTQVFSRYAELLRVRRAHQAFHPTGLQHVIPCTEHVFAVLRVAPDAGERVLCLQNVANTAVSVKLSQNRDGEAWVDLISGEVWHADAENVFTFDLKPYQTVWAQQMEKGLLASKIEARMSRVTRSKQEAKSTYDLLSRWYDLFVGKSERKVIEAGLRMLRIREGETVLEIGFGTGHALLALAQSVGKSGWVYGIDISEGMLNVTHAKLAKTGCADRVALACGDAANLGFTTGFFDAIFMSFALELFDTPEIPVVLRACRWVLRDNGRICIVAMSKGDKTNWATRLYEWAHKKIPTYVDCRPIHVQTALEEAGFRVTDTTEMSMWGLPTAIAMATKQ